MLPYPLLWLSAAFIVGILLGKFFNLPWLAWAIAGFVFLLLSLLDRFLRTRLSVWKRLRDFLPVTPGLVLLLLCLGGLRFDLSLPRIDPSRLAWYNDRGEYTLVGTISAPPDIRSDQVRYEITIFELTNPRSTDLAAATLPIKGTALVTLPRWSQWQYGDQLLFTGSPLTPAEFPDFSYKDYLARQGIQSVIYYPYVMQRVGEKEGSGFRRWLVAIRENSRVTILSLMPQPESGLLEGILLGLDNDIPATLKTAFRDTGTSHIIAISGFNMTLIATLLIFMFSRIFRRYWGVLAAIAVIAVYTLFVDGSSAVVRAAIMASTAAVAHLIGRRQSGINALFFTAAVLCAFNSLLLWDVSFQLSFAAVLGLVVFGTPLQNGFAALAEKWFGEEKAARISSPVSEYFLFTLAAQLTTLPVIAIQFKRISLVSLLANPLILPVQPAILQVGLVTTIAGMIHPVAGKFLAMFTWPMLAYTNFVVSTLGKIQGASMTLHPITAFWILLAVLLVLLVFLLRNFFKKQFGSSWTVWLIVLLIAGSFTTWSIFAHRPDGKLHISLVKAGDAAALFMRTPAGANLLFDLEGDASENSAALTPLLSPWDFHLDALVLSQPVNETLFTDLNQMLRVDSLITSNVVLRPSVGSFQFTPPGGTRLVTLSAGEPLELEPGLTLTVIGEAIERTAYALQYNDVTILIPTGVDYALLKEDYHALMQQPEVLILSPQDVSYIPPRLWSELEPEYILWNNLDPSPYPDSKSLTSETKVTTLVSDGVSLWLEQP